MKIDLSPPPDLVVHSVATANQYYTGDAMKLQFNVSNEGLGEPFYHWWRDRVVSIVGITLKKKEVFSLFMAGIEPATSRSTVKRPAD